MLRRLAGIAGMLALTLTSLVYAQSYAKDKLDVKAGVLIIESARGATSNQPLNYSPFVWYNLDSNTSVKPAGWNIHNPRPITQVTQAVVSRWGALTADVGGTAPALGAPLSKNSAPYWEVRLSQASEAQLSDYDVLLLSAHGAMSLNSGERDKLRKFMDHGGVLWVDIDQTTVLSDYRVNPLPLPFDIFDGGIGAFTYMDAFHPLMSTPYQLGLSNLNQANVGGRYYSVPIDLNAIGMTTFFDSEAWLGSDFNKLLSVAGNSRGPAVQVGRIGDGFMVLTTIGLADAMNRVANGTGYNANNRFYAFTPSSQTPDTDRSFESASKLVINMINLASGHSHAGAGTRNAHSNAIDLGPPLMKRWDSSLALNPGVSKTIPPVMYKGLVVVSGDDRLYVYDANPRTDLDGDGDPDDGIRDFSNGSNLDLLWISKSMTAPISAPTCAEIPGSANRDQILVCDGAGQMISYDCFQVLNGKIQGLTDAPALYSVRAPGGDADFNSSDLGAGPYSPTYHEGLIYISDTTTIGAGSRTGRVWVVDPLAQTTMKTNSVTDWTVGASNLATVPEVSGSPTVGYIPIQDNSGGMDRVMYLPTRPVGFGPTGTAGITSIWLGSRGESPPPNSLVETPGNLQVVTRAARQGLQIYKPVGTITSTQASYGVKLTALWQNGDPFTETDMKRYFKGTCVQLAPGILDFALNQALPPKTGIRLDYTIDLGTGIPALSSQIIRGQLFFPDDTTLTSATDKRRIIGNITMSPRGTLYCIVSNQNDSTTQSATTTNLSCSSFYAVREDIGRGGFRMLTRFDLYPKHQITLNQAAPETYPAALTDGDPLTSFAPGFLAGDFTRLNFQGTPSVRNGIVYVTASGRKGSGAGFQSFVPFTILMAFKAEPEVPEVRVSDLGDAYTILQPDMVRSPSKSSPSIYNVAAPGQFTYDRSEGSLHFDNLMSTTRGPVLNAFSTSQPIIIRRANRPDELIEPDRSGSKWSPLLWYTVQHGTKIDSGVMTTGQSVFMAGTSALPSIITSGNVFKTNGLLSSWNADIPTTDRFLLASPALDPTISSRFVSRFWLKQAVQFTFNGGGPDPNPNIRWPQLKGVRDMQDWMVRLLQTTTNSAVSYGVVGGEGVLTSWGDKGVYSFARADFIVADEGRLVRFDSSGNPLWSSNNFANAGDDTGSVSTAKPLVRPTRGYRMGENDVLAVDTGANRIVRLDNAGREVRSIQTFRLDPGFKPEGFTPNEPLTLSGPRDVAWFSDYQSNPAGVSVGNSSGKEYWVHYVIADTGNKRIVELVDRYNIDANRNIGDAVVVNGQRQLGVLFWQSPSNYSGKEFDYNSVSRVYIASTGRYYYTTGIGSTTPTRVDTGLDTPATGGAVRQSGGNGGIVILDPFDPKNNLIINQVVVPALPSDVYWNFNPPTGSPRFLSNQRDAHYKTLGNLSSVTTRNVDLGAQGTRVAIMFTDATGVYEITQPTAGGDWVVRWMMTNEAWRGMRRLNTGAPNPKSAFDLRATYARRLDSGEVLVVNGYVGKTRAGNEFLGEVVQLDGDIDTGGGTGYNPARINLGFDLASIRFELPPIQGTRGLVLPVFADRR